MFLGNYLLTLDEKGRIAVPRKYRPWLCPEGSSPKPRVIATKNPNAHCLVVYPLKEWEMLTDGMAQHPGLKPGAGRDAAREAEELERELFGKAEDCTIDSQGRVLVPPDLRRDVDLERQVRVIGRSRVFEIWDEPTWSRHRAAGGEGEEGVVDGAVSDSAVSKAH